MKIIAHRGASADAPENTLAAFRLAWEQGADGIEGDFRLTADGEIVCIHDATTARTGDQSLVVSELTLAELKRVDLGDGEAIPTLQEVIDTVPTNGKLVIELKGGHELIEPIADVLATSTLTQNQVSLIAFNADLVADLKTHFPDTDVLWLTAYSGDATTGYSPSHDDVLNTLERTNADGLGTQAHPCVDTSFVQRLKDSGYQLYVWTVDDADRAVHYRDLGANELATNRPGFIRSILLDYS